MPETKPVNFRLSAELMARLDAWIAKQNFPPNRTAVVARALEEYLDAKAG
jgi:hypothetical protein